MNQNSELRYREIQDFDFNDENRMIKGYAIVFDSESNVLGDFVETIDPNALDSVDTSDVYLLHNHNYDTVLARTASGTLSLELTERGLYFSASLPDTQSGNDIYQLIKRGDVTGMSFRFNSDKDEWDFTSEPIKRRIRSIKNLDEISIVPRPAYSKTEVSLRSLEIKNELEHCINCKNDFVIEAKDILESIKTK